MSAQNERQAKIAAAKPKNSNLKTILAGVIGLLVVLAVVVTVVVNQGGDNKAGESAKPGPAKEGDALVLPKGVADKNAPVVSSNGGVLKPGIPTVQIFEDYQCGACVGLEKELGPQLKTMAAAGKINVVHYIKTFQDSNAGNDFSKRIGNAALCAADAGKHAEYHSAIFAKGPKYTDAHLQEAANEAGLTGPVLDTWKKCTDEKRYMPYLRNVEEYSSRTMGVVQTPVIYVNGKHADLSKLTKAEDLENIITETAK